MSFGYLKLCKMQKNISKLELNDSNYKKKKKKKLTLTCQPYYQYYLVDQILKFETSCLILSLIKAYYLLQISSEI